MGAYLSLPTTALGAVGSEHLDAVDNHVLLSMRKFTDINGYQKGTVLE